MTTNHQVGGSNPSVCTKIKIMNKHWIHVDELKEYHHYALAKNEFRGNFEEYKDYFLDEMAKIGIPHTLIG